MNLSNIVKYGMIARMLGGRRRRFAGGRGMMGGGILSALVIGLGSVGIRRLMQRRRAGGLGLREAYSGSSEWAPEQQREERDTFVGATP